MFGTNSRIVQACRNGVNRCHLTIFSKDSVGLHTVHYSDASFGHGRRMLVCVKSTPSCFNTDQLDFFIRHILGEGANSIGTTTYTGNNIVRQAAFLVQNLTTRFFTNHLLELMDNRRIRVRSDSRTQNIEGFQITHPSSKGCIHSILEGFGACFHSVNSRTHHFHAENIEALAFHILCSHVDIALHTKLRCGCRSCHTMLTSSSFSDDSCLAHPLS